MTTIRYKKSELCHTKSKMTKEKRNSELKSNNNGIKFEVMTKCHSVLELPFKMVFNGINESRHTRHTHAPAALNSRMFSRESFRLRLDEVWVAQQNERWCSCVAPLRRIHSLFLTLTTFIRHFKVFIIAHLLEETSSSSSSSSAGGTETFFPSV